MSNRFGGIGAGGGWPMGPTEPTASASSCNHKELSTGEAVEALLLYGGGSYQDLLDKLRKKRIILVREAA